MLIADSHVHIEDSLVNYDLEVEFKNVIFNYVENYKKLKGALGSEDTVSLIFDYKNNLDFILNEASRIDAYKIHTRYQKIGDEDYGELIIHLKKADSTKPIILDAFYYGSDYKHQPDLENYIKLIKSFPERKFVIAHSGGYRILEYFFHLRDLGNVFYELSLSLQYLSDSSHFLDLMKLIKFTSKDKIIFGSDYPFASPLQQFEILKDIFKRLNISQEEQRMILHDNALKVYKN